MDLLPIGLKDECLLTTLHHNIPEVKSSDACVQHLIKASNSTGLKSKDQVNDQKMESCSKKKTDLSAAHDNKECISFSNSTTVSGAVKSCLRNTDHISLRDQHNADTGCIKSSGDQVIIRVVDDNGKVQFASPLATYFEYSMSQSTCTQSQDVINDDGSINWDLTDSQNHDLHRLQLQNAEVENNSLISSLQKPDIQLNTLVDSQTKHDLAENINKLRHLAYLANKQCSVMPEKSIVNDEKICLDETIDYTGNIQMIEGFEKVNLQEFLESQDSKLNLPSGKLEKECSINDCISTLNPAMANCHFKENVFTLIDRASMDAQSPIVANPPVKSITLSTDNIKLLDINHRNSINSDSECTGHIHSVIESEDTGHPQSIISESEDTDHPQSISCESEDTDHLHSVNIESEDTGHPQSISCESEDTDHPQSISCESEDTDYLHSVNIEPEDTGHPQSISCESEDTDHLHSVNIESEDTGHPQSISCESEDTDHPQSISCESEDTDYLHSVNIEPEDTGHPQSISCESEDTDHLHSVNIESEDTGHLHSVNIESEDIGHPQSVNSESEDTDHPQSISCESEDTDHLHSVNIESEDTGHPQSINSESEDTDHPQSISCESEDTDHLHSVNIESEDTGHLQSISCESEDTDHPQSISCESEDTDYLHSVNIEPEDTGHPQSISCESEDIGHPQSISCESEDIGHPQSINSESEERHNLHSVTSESEDTDHPQSISCESEDTDHLHSVTSESEDTDHPQSINSESEDTGRLQIISSESNKICHLHCVNVEPEDIGHLQSISCESKDTDYLHSINIKSEDTGHPQSINSESEDTDDLHSVNIESGMRDHEKTLTNKIPTTIVMLSQHETNSNINNEVSSPVAGIKHGNETDCILMQAQTNQTETSVTALSTCNAIQNLAMLNIYVKKETETGLKQFKSNDNSSEDSQEKVKLNKGVVTFSNTDSKENEETVTNKHSVIIKLPQHEVNNSKRGNMLSDFSLQNTEKAVSLIQDNEKMRNISHCSSDYTSYQHTTKVDCSESDCASTEDTENEDILYSTQEFSPHQIDILSASEQDILQHSKNSEHLVICKKRKYTDNTDEHCSKTLKLCSENEEPLTHSFQDEKGHFLKKKDDNIQSQICLDVPFKTVSYSPSVAGIEDQAVPVMENENDEVTQSDGIDLDAISLYQENFDSNKVKPAATILGCDAETCETPEFMDKAQHKQCFQWKYAPSCDLESTNAVLSDNEDDETRKILPLKTCTKPLRIGLSRKHQGKNFHSPMKKMK